MDEQKTRGLDPDPLHFKHQPHSALRPNGFAGRVNWLNEHPDTKALIEQATQGELNDWNVIYEPLAKDLLSERSLRSLAARYNPEGVAFRDLPTGARTALIQSVITRLSTVLRNPTGGDNEEQHAGQAEGKFAAPNPGSRPLHRSHSAPPPPRGAGTPAPKPPSFPSTRPPPPPAAEKLPPAEAPQSPPPEAEEPAKWDDLSKAEQEQLAEDIKSGRLKPQMGPPPPGAQPLDVSTFPQDLQDQLQEQFQQDMEQAMRSLQQARQEYAAHQQLLDELRKEEGFPPQGEPQAGEGAGEGAAEQAAQEGTGQAEEGPALEQLEDSWAKGDDTNALTGVEAVKTGGTGHGGGGTAMDLCVPLRTYEERMFTIVRDCFARLAAEPDPSDREPEGDEVWNARKLVKGYWRPDLYPLAKQNLARSPENIYFVLDTSNSMQSFANVAASLAAGSLGLVHLYHGSEAHPQIRVDKLEPCRRPQDFKGLGRTNSDQSEAHFVGGERQSFVGDPHVPGYRAFRDEHPGFEGNLEWWLLKERPPKGSRLIFWGDTHYVTFTNVRKLRRLVRDYSFVWLLPFTIGEESVLWDEPEEDLLNHHYGCYGEYPKLMAAGLQVIGGAGDPVGLRKALRKVK